MIKIEQLLELVKEVEISDPIDWGYLSIDEDEATKLMALGVLDLYERQWKHLTPELRDVSMLVTVTKLMLENFVLNIKNLQK